MALLNIAAIDIYRFHIPFAAPVKVGDILLHHREGYLLALTDHRGQTGYGEVAPLPGFDQISLNRCRDDLSDLQRVFPDLILSTEQFDIRSPWMGLTSPPLTCAPHTLFGAECALLNLYLQSKLKEGSIVLPEPPAIPVNGLFFPTADAGESSRQIQTLREKGFQTIKVKIGRLPEVEEIEQILGLADAVGIDVILRLDGNRQLSRQSYARYYTALKSLSVEYAEEPLFEEEAASSGGVPWPEALDESLPFYLSSEHPDLARLPSDIRTIILKPGFVAGLSGMARLAHDASERRIRMVLSSAFNTGVTLTMLGVFSVLANLPPDTAHGLDTLRYLKADVLSASPGIRRGTLRIDRSLLACGMQLNHGVLVKENL